MHKGKYTIICKFKYAEILYSNIHEIVVGNKQYQICKKFALMMQMRNMQYMCIISPKYA